MIFVSVGLGQNYTIQTFAGGGVPQNIQAALANLGLVTGIAVDPAGNVYVALQTYSVVVRMDATGALTLVAGTGTPGLSGDNGPAASAQLNSPWGIALDSAGNLYIADSGNNRIRKVSNGVITTVAGNTAGVQLSNPTGVAVDSSGNLYIADAGNNIVRKVSGGVTVTVAGTGVAGYNASTGTATSVQLSAPWGVAVDGSGNLYLADYGNDSIRKVSNGALTTLVSQPPTGLSPGLSPTGVAIDASGNLFFTAFDFSVVAELTVGGNLTVVAGNLNLANGYSGDNGPAINAQLNGPAAVAVDANGNLYITDFYNNVIRKVAGGVITTVAGGLQGFVGDQGASTNALLFSPTTVATGPSGETYIVDSNHNRVRKVANGVITTVAGSGNPGYSGDGGAALSATLNDPIGVAVDSAGNLYISDSGNSVIRKVVGGVISTIAGTGAAGFGGDNGAATSAALNQPSGLALDATGNLYIADYGNNRIRKLSGGTIATIAGNGTGTYAGDGLPATSASLFGPIDVKLDAAGNLYIADQQNNVIRMVAAGGTISTVAGNGAASFGGDNGPATSAQLNGPSGIAVDSSGNLIISDTTNNVVRRVSGGVITTIAGNGTATYGGDNGPAVGAAINGPLGLATDSLGRIFVADAGNNLVRVLNPPCSFAITNSTIQVSGAGGPFNVGVQAAPFCSWSVSGLPDWITGGAPATGSGTVTLTAAAGSGSPRSAMITVAGISVTVNQAACTYTIAPGGQVFPIAGGMGSVVVTAPNGCAWSATNSIPFVSITGAAAGAGNGNLNFLVSANAGGDRSGALTVAGLPFTVEQLSATLTGLNFIGSMPQVNAQENWITTFTVVNKSGTSVQTRLSLLGDDGNPLPVPLDFPQPPAESGLLASTIDRTIAPNASLVVSTSGPQVPPVQKGAAQLSATGPADGFAIFHLIPGAQEAVVPLETRNASSYLLAFDNTSKVVTGVGIANLTAQPVTVQVVIRDSTGLQIASGPLPVLQPGAHNSFLLTDFFGITNNMTGTAQFSTPSPGQISMLGVRTTPFGNSTTITTLPVLANVGTNGGSIAQIAVANGWKTTFVLVNAGAKSSVAHLKFFDDAGNPLPISISYPQLGGAPTTVSSTDPTLAAGAMLMIEGTGLLSDPVQIGSAQLTTDGNVSGFVIFRYEPYGQEAVVPLESRNAGAYLLAFDNTGLISTGIGVNSVSAQAVDVHVIVRDDTGAQIGTHVIHLGPNGHFADTLAQFSNTLGAILFPETAGIRGTVEFDTPAGSQIGAVGVRIPPGTPHTFTTLPSLAK